MNLRNCRWTACLFLVLVWNLGTLPTVQAAPMFQDGANGTDGVDGDPGTDGTDGQAGLSVDKTINNGTFWGVLSAVATNGGNGGNGGNGVDLNGDLSAVGGNAGHGGAGGDAAGLWDGVIDPGLPSQILRNTHVNAVAGNGGSGGFFGWGTSQAEHGLGGSGARGGNATATANGAFRATANAIGGRGGNAYGATGIAGDGGSTNVQASAYNFGLTRVLSAQQVGGSGGIGYVGATGGNGASVAFGTSVDQLQFLGPPTSYNSYLYVSGFAGQGGDTENGTAGHAGSASFNLGNFADSLSSSSRYFSMVDVELRGGYGGRGFASGTQAVSGNHGGSAAIRSSQDLILNAKQIFAFDLRGGNGGSALGRLNGGNGGNGGAVSLSPLRIVNQFDVRNYDKEFVFQAVLRGGDGGHAQGSGWSGHGADAIVEGLSVDVIGGYIADVQAFGGSGGWGLRSGNGGDAKVDLNGAFLQTGAQGQRSIVRADAIAGNAGEGKNSVRSVNGGSAFVDVDLETDGALNIDAKAQAGFGNYGVSGNAYSNARGVVGRELNRATVTSEATGANNFDLRASNGSRAEALSSAQSHGLATARSTAIGGWGFSETGSARALAEAINTGDQGAKANAYAFAFGDKTRTSDNSPASSAIGIALNANADAVAVAAMTGHFNTATAVSRIESLSGRASSEATSMTTSWEHLAKINTAAYLQSNLSAGIVNSTASFGFRDGALASTAGLQSYAVAQVIPDQGLADSFVQGMNQTILEQVFVGNADAEILGMGSLGGEGSGLHGGSMTLASNFDLTLRLRDYQDDKHMMFGLSTMDATGSGFTDLSLDFKYNGRQIIDESFSSLTDAESFFDGRLIDLGELNNLQELVHFEFHFAMNFESSADAFGLNFVFGNADPFSEPQNARHSGGAGSTSGGFSAVPEPTGAAICLVGMLALFRRRRTAS